MKGRNVENESDVIDGTEPFVHKVGKYVVGGIAGLVASELASKAYDLVLTAVRNHRTAG